MFSGPEHIFRLQPFESNESSAGLRLKVELDQTSCPQLELRFRLSGELDELVSTRDSGEKRADELWRSTCFELFALAPNGQTYREFNFSPSGQWQCYEFQTYRGERSLPDIRPASINCSRTRQELNARIRLDADSLPWPGRIRLGLSAVIERRHGGLSYWSLYHPGEQPDFHHVDGWQLCWDKTDKRIFDLETGRA